MEEPVPFMPIDGSLEQDLESKIWILEGKLEGILRKNNNNKLLVLEKQDETVWALLNFKRKGKSLVMGGW